MKEFTFRVTQPLAAFFEATVTVKAKSEKEARKLLENMPQDKLDEMVTDWETNIDNAYPTGDIEIQDIY